MMTKGTEPAIQNRKPTETDEPKNSAAPCGSPRDAARKYPAETAAATIRLGADAQSAGNSMATGNARTWPLQVVPPTRQAADTRTNDRA
jgi:hypothetical protein